MKEACKLLRSTELYIYTRSASAWAIRTPYYFFADLPKGGLGCRPTEYQEKGREQQDM